MKKIIISIFCYSAIVNIILFSEPNIILTNSESIYETTKEWKDDEPNDQEGQVASSYKRLWNYIIDSSVLVLVILTIIQKNNPDLWLLLIPFLYYFIFEWACGKTLGKLITGTKVIKHTGGNDISLGDSFIRTLCRFVPLEGFSYINNSNGWHDSLSYTKVINEQKSKQPTFEELGGTGIEKE